MKRRGGDRYRCEEEVSCQAREVEEEPIVRSDRNMLVALWKDMGVCLEVSMDTASYCKPESSPASEHIQSPRSLDAIRREPGTRSTRITKSE